MFMLYKSGRLKEDSGCACECVEELTSYRSGVSTLPEQLHIPHTDVCPMISPYQMQATVFNSGWIAMWLQSQGPQAINSAVCPYRLNKLYDSGILKYFCINKPLMKELLKHSQHRNPDLWLSGFVKRITWSGGKELIRQGARSLRSESQLEQEVFPFSATVRMGLRLMHPSVVTDWSVYKCISL